MLLKRKTCDDPLDDRVCEKRGGHRIQATGQKKRGKQDNGAPWCDVSYWYLPVHIYSATNLANGLRIRLTRPSSVTRWIATMNIDQSVAVWYGEAER